MKPLAIDLFCGLGGWAEGLIAEGYRVLGFDIEAHDYEGQRYPGELELADVRTLHGSRFADAALIVASPPCQGYSYRAMPWRRAKALPPPDNSLFEAPFRIQREAIAAAGGRHIPLIVENVRGAQRWVGPARWNFGSFYLWGDVPALMPIGRALKSPATSPAAGARKDFRLLGVKQPGLSGPRDNGRGDRWFQDGAARYGSRSSSRKAAQAMIAKIPLPLSRHIGATFAPRGDGP